MYVFDLDGTLTDSNGLWVEVDREFLSRRGLTITQEYEDEVGRRLFPSAAQFTRDYYHLPDQPQDIMAEWEGLAAHHYQHRVELKHGALAFLEQCRREGRDMALFTACRPSLGRLVVERFGLDGYFRHIVYAEQLGLDKHNPRCLTQLCQILNVPPHHCTLFDDNPFNCAAARATGMTTVGVYDPFYRHRQREMQAVCHRYVRSLAQFLTQP